MNRSIERVLTTHVGSLPRPTDLLDAIEAEQQDRPTDKVTRAARLRSAVKEVVCTQVEIGIDIIDDGEFGKPSFVSYVNERLGGFEIDRDSPRQNPWAQSREARSFPEFYAASPAAARPNWMICIAPVTYRGMARLQIDIDNLEHALDGANVLDVFMPAISPASAADWLRNGYYKSDEEFRFAIADALREEYEAIVDAGLVCRSTIRSWRATARRIRRSTSRNAANGRDASVEAVEPRAARYPAGTNPLPHLLRHQYGSAGARHGTEADRRHHAADQCRRLFVRGRPIRGTSTNGGCGRMSNCRRARS